MSSWTRLAPWAAAVVGILCVAAPAMRSPYKGSTDLTEFAALPVVEGGRVKPMDTVARTNLTIVSSRQTFDVSDEVTGKPAIEWLLDVMAAKEPFTGEAAKLKVFRITSLEVLSLLKLEPRPGFYRYSLQEIGKHYDELEKERQRAFDRDPKTRDSYDMAILELAKHLRAFEQLAKREEPLVVPPADGSADGWRSLADVDAEAVAPFRDAVLAQARERILAMLKEDKVNVDNLGPEAERRINQAARNMAAPVLAQLAEQKRGEVSAVAGAFSDILTARRAGDAAKFAEAVAAYKAATESMVKPREASKARLEVLFNRVAPFISCSGLYVIAFILAAASWVVFPDPLRRAAVGLLMTTLVVHTAALLVRMYLLDRPWVFVTNLYSSAVFIGWAAVLLGLTVELVFGRGLGTAVAAIMGFASLLIAHFLGMDGDTLQMMQAVLDTNFWLSTHVTVVTLGYAATYIAGFFGIAYIATVVVRDNLDAPTARALSGVIYGIVCFATLASFLGTVLGGIWADQSWGRFWGWDPKENGAVLIVIWNALILHARWGGMVKARGVAVLAVLGCIVTTWSWFGTNQLGVGLHAYGFRSGMAATIVATSIGFLTIAGVGMLPPTVWQSLGFRSGSQAKPAVAAVKERRGKPATARV
ncbi:MAG: cytochrome c biogenesis protein CcsA [Gemmataceae bacterium]